MQNVKFENREELRLNIHHREKVVPMTAASNLPGVPLVENPLFPSFVDSLGFDSETKRVAMDLHLKGYAVIEFPAAEFGAVAEGIKETLATQFDFE